MVVKRQGTKKKGIKISLRAKPSDISQTFNPNDSSLTSKPSRLKDNYVREDKDEGAKPNASKFDSSARKEFSGKLLQSNEESGPAKKFDATANFAAKEKDSAEQEPNDVEASAPDKDDGRKKQRQTAINFSSVNPLQAAEA